jgi:hypothetical protein
MIIFPGSNWGGDYSRFSASDAENKGYVALLKERGKAVLDDDFNFLQDVLLGLQVRAVREIIGDCAPGNGFKVENYAGGDFALRAGAMYVGGLRAWLSANMQYTAQTPSPPALTPPPPWTTTVLRLDTVYIDVWLDEVGPNVDPDMVDPTLAVETSRRLKLFWQVRVAEAGTPVPAEYTDGSGRPHYIARLAIIQHAHTVGSVVVPMAIVDARKGMNGAGLVGELIAAHNADPNAHENQGGGGGATVPGAPTGVSATGADKQATISFDPPASDGGSSITGYTVRSNPGNFTASGFSSPITVTGLTNGTSYTFTVTATNAVGTGPASQPSNAVTPQAGGSTVPSAPQNVSAVPGDGRATVSFSPPANNGGSAISSYTVIAAIAGTGMQPPIEQTGSGSPITVMGLTNGQAYNISVRATNASGTGPASSPAVQVTPSASATTPSAPQNVAVSMSDYEATVTFDPPASNGGSAIIEYVATFRAVAPALNLYIVETSASPAVFTIPNDHIYDITVKARNAVGFGPASSPPVREGRHRNEPPTGVSAVAGDGQATVSFTPGSNWPEVTLFTVTSSPGGIQQTGSSSPITVSGLNNGTSYTFTVTQTNSESTSAPSAPSNAVIPGATIGGPPNGAGYFLVNGTSGQANLWIEYTSAGAWQVLSDVSIVQSSSPKSGDWLPPGAAAGDYEIMFQHSVASCNGCSITGSASDSFLSLSSQRSKGISVPNSNSSGYVDITITVREVANPSVQRVSTITLNLEGNA